MFSRTLRSLRHTLALRLTVWYAGIFAVSSIVAFAFVYAVIVSLVQQRTDEELEDDVEEFAVFMQEGGLDRVKSEMDAEAAGEEASQSFIRLWSPEGESVVSTDLSAWPGLEVPREALSQLGAADPLEGADETILETFTLAQREDRVRSVYGAIAPDLVLQIGESLQDDDEFLEAFASRFLIALAAVIVLGGPIGWFMARRALRGVEEITRTATEITQGALDRRVAVGSGGDELDKLAQTFNTMLDRIQALIIGMREMTDNLAHDLRSPLTRIRAAAEMALTGAQSSPEQDSLAVNTTEECDRLLEMINVTLDIAEAESGAAKLKITEVDLVDVVRGACELFETVAEDKQITIHTDLPAQCMIRGDLQRLQRVVSNLLDNALKYTPAEGDVTIALSTENDTARIVFEDNGTGMVAEELSHIFERFYRCERSRSEPGNGLGLSLVLAFVRAHGGDVTVTSTPGQGSAFAVALPR